MTMKKNKVQQGNRERWSGSAILEKVVSKGLPKKVPFEHSWTKQRLKPRTYLEEEDPRQSNPEDCMKIKKKKKKDLFLSIEGLLM